MTIDINAHISAIKKHLSIIGKRLYGKDGKNLFSDITLSSAEERNILSQYILSSYQDIEGVLKQFITASTENNGVITANITNTRGDTDFDNRVQRLAETYIIYNSVAEYLAMLHPELAQKYQRDAQQRIEMLVAYVFYKKPYESTTDFGAYKAVTNPLPPTEDPEAPEALYDP